MQSSNVTSRGVMAREEASATREGDNAARGMSAARGRGVSARGARRFATRGARHQAVSRMTSAERDEFWAEEARRCGITLSKFVIT